MFFKRIWIPFIPIKSTHERKSSNKQQQQQKWFKFLQLACNKWWWFLFQRLRKKQRIHRLQQIRRMCWCKIIINNYKYWNEYRNRGWMISLYFICWIKAHQKQRNYGARKESFRFKIVLSITILFICQFIFSYFFIIFAYVVVTRIRNAFEC